MIDNLTAAHILTHLWYSKLYIATMVPAFSKKKDKDFIGALHDFMQNPAAQKNWEVKDFSKWIDVKFTKNV